MDIEDILKSWTSPSSDSEQTKQDRTERMVRAALDAHPPLQSCSLTVYAKGSYANNTNVRADSDVDIAVQCTDCCYWEEQSPGAHPVATPYKGEWTPAKLRKEVVAALQSKFPNQVDISGSTAIQVTASAARVDADVVPCFTHRYYYDSGHIREGNRVFAKDGSSFNNYPAQQLANGRNKNLDTSHRFKKSVRILKRLENAMVEDGVHVELPSYFLECLVYNCPNLVLSRSTWRATVAGVLGHIWNSLEGPEPDDSSKRWMEVNDVKWLFHSSQKWSRNDGRHFAKAAWNYLGLGT